MTRFGLVFVLLLACGANAFAQQWQWQNPLPQGDIWNAIKFVDSLYGWAASDDQIWRTTDGGTHWARTNLDPAPYLFQSLAFVDRHNGWGISNYDVLVHTTDGGDHWTCQILAEGCDYIHSACFIDSLHGWVGGQGGGPTYGLMWTDNGGRSWQWRYPGIGRFVSLKFTDRLHGWAVTGSSQLYRTVDGGMTWTVAYTDGYNLYSVDFTDHLHGWCAGAQNASTAHVISTTNGGTTWTATPVTMPVATAKLIALDSLHVWLFSGRGMETVPVYCTSNGGVNWQSVTYGGISYPIDFAAAGSGSAWVTGQFGSIVHTTDNGATWSPQHSSVAGASFYGAVAVGEQVWAVGEGTSILHTDNGGSYWYPQPSGAPPATLNAIAFVAPRHVWAAGDAGTLLASTNGGTTWTLQASGTTSNLLALAFADSLHGWLAGYGPTLKHTTDGGANWTSQLPPGAPNPVYDLSCASADSAWAVAGNAIYRTADSGNTWAAYSLPADYAAKTLAFSGHLQGWCGGRITGQGGFVMHTTDGGQTWTAQQPFLANGSYNGVGDMLFVDPQHGWLVPENASTPQMRYTTDGGQNWITDGTCALSVRRLAGSSTQAVWGVGWSGVIQRLGAATPPLPVTDLVVCPVNDDDLQLRWTAAAGFIGTYTVYASADILPFPQVGWTVLATGITPAPAEMPTTWTDVDAAQTLPRRYYTVTATLPTPAPPSPLPADVRARLTNRSSEHPLRNRN